MRLLHVTPFYEPAWSYGGMARASSGLCRALSRRGHEVTVVTVRLDDSPAEERLGGVRVRRLAGPAALSRRLFPWAPSLRRVVLAEASGATVVHLHGHRSGVAWAAWRALTRTRTPWVLQTHGTFPHHGQLRLFKWLFDRFAGARIVAEARALIAVSHAEALDLPRQADVVPNGVHADTDVPPRSKASEGRGILFVGTDRPQKRARVLPELLARLPDASLDLVGSFAPSFLHCFRSLGSRVVARSVLAGADLSSAYASASVVVHPAVREAFGMVPFEAALQGTASVVAGGHGCGEWFARAGGCVVPPDDPNALATAVNERLSNRDLATREARSVADFIRRELTWERAAEAMESIYLGVLETRRRGAA
jgi:glycosyltransferase involved in cell wall biosynthesis